MMEVEDKADAEMTTVDISPEAVERLAQIEENGGGCDLQFLEYGPTLRALSSALQQSRAETAAAYEAAADTCKASYPSDDEYDLTVPVEKFACETERATVTCCQFDIRALTSSDQSAALAAVVSAAEARGRETGMREALNGWEPLCLTRPLNI